MVVLFYTASTVIIIPHTALGAELTDSYHDRTRIFGGAPRAVDARLVRRDRAASSRSSSSSDVRRDRDRWLAIGAAVATALLTLWTVLAHARAPRVPGPRRDATRTARSSTSGATRTRACC